MILDELETLELKSALYEVLDPETGLSVVDLGLIYELKFLREEGEARVLMTLTTPACPAGGSITDGVRRRLERVQGVKTVEVELTFEPRWTPDRISSEGREQLGLL